MALLWRTAVEAAHEFRGWHGDRYNHLAQHGLSNKGWGVGGGSDAGTGLYATEDRSHAHDYAFGYDHEDHDQGALLPVKINTKGFVNQDDPPQDVLDRAKEMAQRANSRNDSGGYLHHHTHYIGPAAQELGHPGLHMGSSVVSFLPGDHAQIDHTRQISTKPECCGHGDDDDYGWH